MKNPLPTLVFVGLSLLLPGKGFCAGLDFFKDKAKKLKLDAVSKALGGDSKERELAIYFGVAAGTLLTEEIVKKLSQKDQQEVSNSSTKALETGQKQEWSNPESGARGTAQVTKTERRTEGVRMRRGGRVNEIPPLEIIGKRYKTVAATTIYAKADATSGVVANHASGVVLDVTGKVKDGDWYFIGEKGVGIGFAKPASFSSQPEPDIAVADAPAPADAPTQIVEVEREYKTITQEIVLPDGTVHKEEVTLVKDPSGKWVAAPKTTA